MGILEGIRVIEFTHMVAGPACGQVLADLGAEVIKVEPPGGDITRTLGPATGGVSALFGGTNRTKRSVRLDLRRPEDAASARALALGADVVVSNIDPAMLQAAGLGSAELRAENPALVVVEVTAFGPGGALGTDGIAQAAMGLMSLTGAPEGPTFRTGPSVVDVSTGVWAALGVLAALMRRGNGGQGDVVRASLADVCLYMQYAQLALHGADPASVRRNGNHSMLSCTPVVQASDGRLILTILHDRHWQVVCEALGRPDLLARADLATNAGRCEHQDLIEALLGPVFGARSRAEWIEVFRAKRIPCGPERTYAEIEADAALRERGLLFRLGEDAGILQVGMPVSFAEGGPPAVAPAPTLGEADPELADLIRARHRA